MKYFWMFFLFSSIWMKTNALVIFDAEEINRNMCIINAAELSKQMVHAYVVKKCCLYSLPMTRRLQKNLWKKKAQFSYERRFNGDRYPHNKLLFQY